jgi:hypothetical protein
MKLSLLAVIALLVAGPVLADELDDSLAALNEAQSKKDIALIKKLAAQTSELAKEQAEMEEPADPSLKQAWKERSAWAKDVVKFADYALYSSALGAEPDVVIDLISALEAQNPKSQYLDEGGYSVYFAALTKKGEAGKIPDIAQKALANLPNSIDLLLVLADNAMAKGQTGQGARGRRRGRNTLTPTGPCAPRGPTSRVRASCMAWPCSSWASPTSSSAPRPTTRSACWKPSASANRRPRSQGRTPLRPTPT